MARRLGLLILAVSLTALPAVAGETTSERMGTGALVSDADVHAVAAQLRCVVCQSLSVADSPSEMAAEMRGIVRERLAAGETPDQVVRYFVDKYGEWILLAPPRRGFTLLVWILPPVAVLLGLGIVVQRLRLWSRRAAISRHEPVDAAMRERIRKELETQP
jgi:cytochrome c-type biogenesis protein CcmH